MLSGVAYLFPSHKLCTPRHKSIAKCEKVLAKMQSSPKRRLAVAVHEANHFLTAQKFGLNPKYSGPAIEHVKESDEWVVVYGATQIPQAEYAKLTTEQLAEYLAAGDVAETVLLDSSLNGGSGDFEAFISSGRAPVSELILRYKQTQERMTRELQASLEAQRQIIYAAQNYEQDIFGVDCPVRERKDPKLCPL